MNNLYQYGKVMLKMSEKNIQFSYHNSRYKIIRFFKTKLYDFLKHDIV